VSVVLGLFLPKYSKLADKKQIARLRTRPKKSRRVARKMELSER
jgi:hypothetical protein